MNTEIKAALLSIQEEGIFNQALQDCLLALNLGKATLELHFQLWLWGDANTKPYEGVDLAYAIQLGGIEEYLVEAGLIYSAD